MKPLSPWTKSRDHPPLVDVFMKCKSNTIARRCKNITCSWSCYVSCVKFILGVAYNKIEYVFGQGGCSWKSLNEKKPSRLHFSTTLRKKRGQNVLLDMLLKGWKGNLFVTSEIDAYRVSNHGSCSRRVFSERRRFCSGCRSARQ